MTASQARVALAAILARTWAGSTTQQKKSLYARLRAWALRERLKVNAETACLWIASTGISPQGMLGYARNVSGTMAKLGMDASPLWAMQSALRACGGTTPIGQVAPLLREPFIRWANRQSRSIRAAAMLAWKTSSRWEEARKITQENVLRSSPSEIVVDWKRLPKGRRSNPFHPSRWTVIRGPGTAELHRDLRMVLSPSRPLCSMTTNQMSALLKNTFGKKVSSRSIKRGAVSHLVDAAAKHRFDPRLIPLVAKHQHEAVLPPMTVRYNANPIQMARLLNSGAATMHL